MVLYLILSNTLYMCLSVILIFFMIRGVVQITYTPRQSYAKVDSADAHEQNMQNMQHTHQEEVETPLSDSEVERLAWISDFDKRIEELKEEVASELPIISRTGTIAQETDGVYNLPHNAVVARGGRLEDEVAE
jgi:PBP1b-binding outer membrane lipoprotein LpoB